MRFVRFATILSLVAGLLMMHTATASASEAGARHVAAPGPWNKTITGRVVDADTGRPVAFAVVRAFHADFRTPQAATVSWFYGWFKLNGLYEESAIHVSGALSDHETGWLSCSRQVVATPGEACTFGPGDVGSIRLDRR